MNFVDWNWKAYNKVLVSKEYLMNQQKHLYPTGLCEGSFGIEYVFVPTMDMKALHDEILNMYNKLRVEDHEVDLCSEVFFTTKIEGATTTIKRTQQLHNGERIDESNAFSEYMVLGAFNATKLMNLRGNRVSHDILREVWEKLTFGCCENADIEGTQYRVGNVQVGNHVGCNPDLLYDAMESWIKYYTSDGLKDYPFIKAALLHYAFEFTHPFCDGNGRLGRLLMNSFLIKEGYDKIKAVSFSKQIDMNRVEYDLAFAQSENINSDCTPFITFMLEQMYLALKDILQSSNLISITDNI